jgi:hypothetical protein
MTAPINIIEFMGLIMNYDSGLFWNRNTQCNSLRAASCGHGRRATLSAGVVYLGA